MNSSYAQSTNMTCVNNENKFITNYKIDIASKTIFHLSSMDSANNKRYVVNEAQSVLSADGDIIVTLNYSNNGNIINLKVFNLKEQTYTQSGHYLDSKRKPNTQLFECVMN
jgi:hypothetical protein